MSTLAARTEARSGLMAEPSSQVLGENPLPPVSPGRGHWFHPISL